MIDVVLSQWKDECLKQKPFHHVLTLAQMKGKREFPPDIPASGDVLSHLSELEMNTAAIFAVIKVYHVLHLRTLPLCELLFFFV